jgi:hypothetical protein
MCQAGDKNRLIRQGCVVCSMLVQARTFVQDGSSM